MPKDGQEIVQCLTQTVTGQILGPNLLASSLLFFCSLRDKGQARAGWSSLSSGSRLLLLEASQTGLVTGGWHERMAGSAASRMPWATAPSRL